MPIILVADDNSNIQKMVSLALEARGMQVVAVGNGEAAVRRISDVHPDVVLADVFMPVRSGYEVCEFVKKDARFAQTPVILLVGAFDPLDEKEARRVGADGVLKKPFVPPDPLIAMVFSLLEKTGKSSPAPQLESAAPQAAAPPPQAAAPPPATPKYSEPEPQPEPEPAFDEFAVGHGPLSLREEDNSPVVDSLLAAAGSGNEAGNPWDEPQGEWEPSRAQTDFEIPEGSGREAFEPHADSEPAISSGTEAVRPEDFVTEESSLPPVEPGTLADLAANPAEWIEMMSAPSSAEPSEPKKPWHAPAPFPEPAAPESQSWHAKMPADEASLKKFVPWQDEPPAVEAPQETTAASEAAPFFQAPPKIASEAVRAQPEAPHAFPESTDATHSIPPESMLLAQPIEAWPPAPAGDSAANTAAEWGHTEPAPEVTSAWNSAPAAEPEPPLSEPAAEDVPKPEYELLIAPAAAIPIHPTSEPEPAPWKAAPIEPRDLEAESSPKQSEGPSPYASYLPSEGSPDVLPTSQLGEPKTAVTDPATAGTEPALPAQPWGDPAMVEAVVTKVLERLRPELEEMLSQESVRSLVESVLQHELQKK